LSLILFSFIFCPVLFLLLAIYARTIFNCFSVLLAMMVDGWCQGLRFGNSKVS
jgi:membrane protein required for beta-lactamase induction